MVADTRPARSEKPRESDERILINKIECCEICVKKERCERGRSEGKGVTE